MHNTHEYNAPKPDYPPREFGYPIAIAASRSNRHENVSQYRHRTGDAIATAERFAKEGFRIVLSARNEARTRALADQLKSKGYTADVRTVDAGEAGSVATLIAGVERDFGAIDVLHYNAASMRKATLTEQPAETFNSDLAVNIGGAQAAIKAWPAR